jgi:hypothetical protein
MVLGHDPGCQPPNERARERSERGMLERMSEECSRERVRSIECSREAVWKKCLSQLGGSPSAARAMANLRSGNIRR